MDIQETIQFNLGATYNEGLEEGSEQAFTDK